MWRRPILTETPRCRILLPGLSVYSLQQSAQPMRLSLSRLTALVVIGVALAAIPGVVSRVGGREGAARMTTRGGFPRLASAAAALNRKRALADWEEKSTGTLRRAAWSPVRRFRRRSPIRSCSTLRPSPRFIRPPSLPARAAALLQPSSS